ncbi:MAG: hypothetical protein IJA47_02920 [Oscillospiraceae bacterium]|nr:hypothetical protein [Oscillospiraceae bacterium]
MKMKNTKRALLLSALSLLLCVSMLVGSTFAWFTDSVTSGQNKIASGNLDVQLFYTYDPAVAADATSTAWVEVDSNTDVFGYNLWEPGYTKVAYFKIVNNGSLELKYQLAADVYTEKAGKNQANTEFLLSDYIKTALVSTTATRNDILALVGTPLKNSYDMSEGTLASKGSAVVGMAIWMPTSVGNEANHNGTDVPEITFGINLVATQATKEKDSFNDQYDKDAQYPGLSTGVLEPGQRAIEIPVTDGTDAKVGNATIPAEALAPGATSSKAKIQPLDYEGNFTIGTGMESKSFHISVSNLKENNDVPVKVLVYVGKGMDPTTFKLYHYDTEIPCTYDPYDGYVTFESATFSPFTIVYDADSEYVAPELPPVADPDVLPEDLPKATVAPYTPEEEIEWGNYGKWSPTEGLEANLDTIYKFTCQDTLAEAEASPYAYWECDFYVKLDRDLGANEIFLGGNYGDFGWIGFHNGDLTLEANTEIPMLGSVAGSWKYVDVVQNVGEFICGVGNVGNSLEGATFTVMLRLTNPEDRSEFYNVKTITYTFPTVVNSADELQDAINNGSTNIQLGGDIDLNNGSIVIP